MKPLKIRFFLIFQAFLLSGTVFIAGCKVYSEYRQDRVEKAIRHFNQANNEALAETHPLTLSECIQIALERNLELRLARLEQGIAKEARTAELLGLLPSLTLSDTLSARSNTPGTRAQKITPDGQTYGYTAFQEKSSNAFTLDMALSVLDFGLACFNTQQAQSRLFLANQHMLRTAQNITLDVVKAYVNAAVAQRTMTFCRQALSDSQNRYTAIAELARNGKILPSRSFDEARELAEMERRLAWAIEEYETASINLRSLMGTLPGETVTIDDSILNKPPEFNIPEITLLEQIALIQRPELYQSDIKERINLLEYRKEMLKIFPNVRLFASFSDSNDQFLYNSSWWELGLRATYDLLKLPQRASFLRLRKARLETDETRTYTQALGIMAQVRLAHSALIAAEDRCKLNARLSRMFDENMDFAHESKPEEITPLIQLELDHMNLVTIEARMAYCRSIGDCHIAFYQLLNTLGMQDIERKTIDILDAELKTARLQASDALRHAQADLERQQGRTAQNDLFADPTAFTPNVAFPGHLLSDSWTHWL